MWSILSRLRVFRRVRRDYIRRKLKRDFPLDNYRSARRSSKKRVCIIILLLPAVLCFFFLMAQSILIGSMESIDGDFNETAANETLAGLSAMTSLSEGPVTSDPGLPKRRMQVQPPKPRRNVSSEKTEHQQQLAYANRVLALLRINKLLKEQRNSFTPLPVGHNVATSSTPLTPRVLPVCLIRKNYTGPILNTSESINLEEIYPMIQKGGYFRPSDCVSRHKIAIIVPYRNRTKNLSIFLYNIHPFLMNQNLEYQLFVIEQQGDKKFNKGRLFNAGYKEAKKYGEWKCVLFHDVDLLPTNGQILYTCPRAPRHMSSAVYDINGTLSVNATVPLFGGVTALTMEQYEKVNGHSNLYWGWGGEDIDMFHRLKAAPYQIARYNRNISTYVALPHPQEKKNPRRYLLLSYARERSQNEGLNTILYQVISVTSHHLYTHIVVDVTASDMMERDYEDYFFQNEPSLDAFRPLTIF